MPKYVDTSDFGTPKKEVTSESNAMNNLDKISSLIDKGLNLFDKITAMQKYKQQQDISPVAQIENKAHKEAEKIVAMQQANAPQPVLKMDYDVENAFEDLKVSLNKLESFGVDTNKTLKQFLEEDFVKLKESGLVHYGIEQFLKKYVRASIQ